ncbi:acid phosphatase [Niveibacterium terrae]|uniref:acid phosphatase n=1 Tax=Niveibacterium terrae TaxID=3373598 RepID=UPI003A942513
MRQRAVARLLLQSTLLLALASCATPPLEKVAGPDGRYRGYLAAAAVPSSLVQVPPPPAPGSAAMALDEEIAQRSFALRNTPRWKQAAQDADLSFPHAAGIFACAVNTAITEADTPRLYRLLQRSLADLGASTRSAKKHYQRPRPFMVNKEPICTPEDSEDLAKNGSYPSGHNAAGWGWALILAELSPEQADAILVRGRNYGESRNVCNVHWHSDVMQGRLVGAGTVARLHAEPAFLADLAAAREELAAARKKGLKPQTDCAAEAAALAITPSLAQ